MAGLKNVERVDIVPFHQMGRHKWEDLGIPYKLKDTEPPTPAEVRRVQELFENEGVSVGIRHLAPCAPKDRSAEVTQHEHA